MTPKVTVWEPEQRKEDIWVQEYKERMFVSPWNSYVEILPPSVMVLGGRAFGDG